MKKKAIPAPQARGSWHWRKALPFAALWALTLVAYSNSFQSGLVYDNAAIVGKDPRLHALSAENLRLILTGEYWYPRAGNGLYRPFTTFTYLVNYSVLGNGADPAGYHLINYAIHSVNASLVFLLGLFLFGEIAPAFAMAAIWAVHPVLTESVTNIVGRADLLGAFGVLAALLCYARSREEMGRRRVAWWIGCAAASAIGVFSKESAIVVVGAIPLFDIAFRKGQAWRGRLIGYAAVALPCVLFLLARRAALSLSPAMHVLSTENPIAGAAFWPGRLTAVGVIGRQIALMAWPWRLSADYSYNAIPLANGLTAAVAGGIAVLLGAAALAFWGFRRDRKVFFLVLFGLGALLPTSNLLFPIGTIMAERFLYLPAVAFAGCLVTAFALFRRRVPEAALRGAFAVIVLAFAGRTFARNSDWLNEQTLFASAETAVPASFRPHNDLISIDDRAGKLDDAVREADTTIQILNALPDDRNLSTPYITAGKAYSDRADSLPAPEGAPWRKRALDALRHAERIEDAARGERSRPVDHRELYEHLGYVEMRDNDLDEAVPALEKAMRLGLSTDVFINLATAYVGKKDSRNAEVTILEGVIWQRQNEAIAKYMVQLYNTTSPSSCALVVSGNSTHLNAACPLVQGELCEASARLIPLLEAQGEASEAARVRTGVQHAGCSH